MTEQQPVLVVGDLGHQFLRAWFEAVGPRFGGSLVCINTSLQATPEDWPYGKQLLVHEFGIAYPEASALLLANLRLAQFVEPMLRNAKGLFYHFLRPRYALLSLAAKRGGIPYGVALWGSDYYRSEGLRRIVIKRLLANAKVVTANTETMYSELQREGFVKKRSLKSVRFGTAPGGILLERLHAGDPPSQSASVEVSLDHPLIVVIGISASAAQQHLAVIDSLAQSLPPESLSRLLVVVPMTYGGTADYCDQVERALQDAAIPHRVLRKFMSDEEMAMLRASTDVFVNVQPTDAASGSMQESMLCGAHIIFGSWLDYSGFNYPRERWWAVDDVAQVGSVITDVLTQRSARPRTWITDAGTTIDWEANAEAWVDALDLLTSNAL